MTSNAAADEIQQIIKAERTGKISNVIEEELKNENSEGQIEKGIKTYNDEYAGAIKFLESPITENFLVDIKDQLRLEFEKSFRSLKEYDFLEKQIKKADKTKDKKSEKEVNSTLKSAVLERLSTMFLPEFLNRLDDIIIFQPLKQEELRKICDIMVRDVAERIKSKQITLIVDDKVKVKLTREGYNPLFGARPLRRLITKYVEDLISENILQNPLSKKSRTIKIQLNDEDQIVVKKDEL
jgi:ATP-dependent protease Clp ATPase subunit